ncbi:hypothetical protein ACQUSR_20690 [Streptomyces sp. P1-3]|uniref:hypothetical protein n=1 Tax=Streptomyces sp. P1-3 TaxID=3421658 RepID=UPI003D35C9DF
MANSIARFAEWLLWRLPLAPSRHRTARLSPTIRWQDTPTAALPPVPASTAQPVRDAYIARVLAVHGVAVSPRCTHGVKAEAR